MHRLPALLAVAVTAVAASIAVSVPADPAAAIALEGGDPIGSLELAESLDPSTLVVAGWAVDPDTAAPVDVRVEVAGAAGTPPLELSLGPASIDRPEVGATYDGIGDQHGFHDRLDLPVGTDPSRVDVYAANAPDTPGADQLIGSMPIDPEPNAFGALESITATPDGYVRIRGWTASTSGAVTMLTVWVGVKSVGFPGSGVYHPLPARLGYGGAGGFDALAGGPPYFSAGPHRICVDIGYGSGLGARLGCRTVSIVEDRFPPETTLTSGPPASGADTTVELAFTNGEPVHYGSSGLPGFECRWGLGQWSGCRSPVVTTAAPATYTFSVRARDDWGNIDQTPATTTFTVTEPPPPRLVVRADAVRHRSRLRIDVDPDSADHDYRFRVEKRVDDRWRTVARRSTRGSRDTKLLDLDRGRYRVVVPAQHGMLRDVDRTRLRR
nr:hypothetical protein [uncultured Nocardioides sp.]